MQLDIGTRIAEAVNVWKPPTPELYLVRLQSRIPKLLDCTTRTGIRRRSLCLKKGMTLRVMAMSDKEAQEKALFRKRNSLAARNSYIVRWSRKFYA